MKPKDTTPKTKPKTQAERLCTVEAQIMYLYTEADTTSRRVSAAHARIDEVEKYTKAAITVLAVTIAGLALVLLR